MTSKILDYSTKTTNFVVMNKTSNSNNNLAEVKKKALIQRVAIIATTVIVVVCCVIVMVKKREKRNIEWQQQEAIYIAEYKAHLQREREEAAQRAKERRLRDIEYQRMQDSLAALQKVETPEPRWTWSDIEDMVRNLTDENYYASIWIVEYDMPNWVVIYTKSGKIYFRHFNAEKKTYGAKIHLIDDGTGKYHVLGNKRNRYVYQNNDLVHEINGVEKERFYGHTSIDLFTPEDAPDGYDSWEDYYYDNEEDFRTYYGY